jgi:hypothetical protein
MATWKKIIVSGSNAELNKLNVGANQQISSSASSTFLSGSFSGSFEGTLKSALASSTQPNIVGYDTATGLFSYQGTGSFTAATASYVTASNVYGPYGANSVLSASYAVTAAYAANVPATSSYALQALSASNAGTASLVNILNAPGGSETYQIPFVGSSAYTGSLPLYTTSSGLIYENANNTLAVNIAGTASRATLANTASYVAGANVVGAVTTANTASYVVTANTASYVAGANVVGAVTTANTASYVLNAVSASFATNANTASYVLNTVSSSFATNASTASYVNPLNQAVIITGSLSLALTGSASLTVEGNQFAQTYLSTAGAMVLNPGTGGVGMAGVNQYINAGYFVGQTAGTILTGSFTGSFKGDGSGLTGVPSSSFATSALSSSFASTAGNANSISNSITNNTNNYLLTATGGGSINGESTLTYDGSTLTVGGNANITGNLTVAGTASFYNQTTLEVADKFIILASGSTSLTDGGIIVASGGTGQNISGSAFFLESVSAGTYGRFAIASNIHSSASSVAADEYMVSAKISGSAPSVDPTWGGSGNGGGNIYINSSNGDIYIYS